LILPVPWRWKVLPVAGESIEIQFAQGFFRHA
jgi:hypothetical protein